MRVAILIILSLCSTHLFAQSHDLPVSFKAPVTKIVQPYVKRKEIAGVVVGIVTPKGNEILGFGKERENRPRTPDGDTIFMLGSVQKLFAGVMLAKITLDKKVKLDESINDILPANKQAQVMGRSITLVDLATHSSGLPDRAANPPSTKGRFVSEKEQTDWIFSAVHKLKPQYAPGTYYEYSNFGAVLLRDLLAFKTQVPYRKMTEDDIFVPLQMTSTFARPPADAFSRIAQGYSAKLKPFRIQTIGSYQKVPVEQYYSTANDMVKFLEANLGLKPTSLFNALEMTQVSYFKTKKNRSMGLMWHIRDGNILSKNGQSGSYGFHSFIIFDKSKKFGVVVLSNTANPKVDRMARDIFEAVGKSIDSDHEKKEL